MDAFTQTALPILVAVVMFFGLLSVMTNILPGLVIIWLAALAYGLVAGFNVGSGILFAIITLLMIIGSVIDNVLMGASARQSGASWLAIGAALLAGLIGSLLWTPIGGLAAALLTLFIIEFIRLRDWRKAVESARNMATGCGWSVIVRFGIAIVMITLWISWALWLV